MAFAIKSVTAADSTFSSNGKSAWDTGFSSCTSGISGGLIFCDSTTTINVSALLASGGVVIGGGAGTAPFTSAGLTYSATGSVTGGPQLTVGTTGTSAGFSFGTISNTIGGIWASGLTNSAVNYAFGAYSGGTLVNAPVNTQIRLRINDATSAFFDATSIKLGSNERLFVSSNNPTISSGFGSSPSIVASSGSWAFTVNVGTGGAASSGVIALPASTVGWAAKVENLTAVAANRADQRTVITATTTTTITVQNQTISTGAALAWTASDVLQIIAFPY